MALSAESQIASLLGAQRMRQPAGIEALAAGVIVEPADGSEIAELVRKCERDRITLVPIGAARTAALVRRQPAQLGVSLVRLNRVLAYEPDDMTIAAEAGLALDALNRTLERGAQRLPCDPPEPQITTLGALIGAAKAGPLRHREGTVRDLLIGIRFVAHGGRTVHAGGRVVKNVAGYDLMKIMTGSFGTLGIITEATFKVRPVAPDYRLALAGFTNHRAAFDAAAELNDALPLLHLDVISKALAEPLDHPGECLIAAGFAGNPPELDYQSGVIRNLAGGASEIRDGLRAGAGYRLLRDLGAGHGGLAANLAVPPAELSRCLERCGAEFRAHAGRGVAQLFAGQLTGLDDSLRMLARWREAAHAAAGHIRVLDADSSWRAELPIFDEPNRGALSLMRRLKAAFDPAGVFNPGAFVGGI